MTWGSNASYDKIPCPYCGNYMIDDSDNDESSHMLTCTWRTAWRAFKWRWFRISHWRVEA